MHTPEQLRALADRLSMRVHFTAELLDEAVAILRAQADALASPPVDPAAWQVPETATLAAGVYTERKHAEQSAARRGVAVVPLYASPPAAEPVAPNLPGDPLIPAWVNVRALQQALDDQRHTPAVYFERQAIDDVKLFLPANQPWPAIKDAPAEPGELPPLPRPPECMYPWTPEEALVIQDWGRLALATSPLPAERVERVMSAVDRALASAMLDGFCGEKARSSAPTEAFSAAVRAILEGRQP